MAWLPSSLTSAGYGAHRESLGVKRLELLRGNLKSQSIDAFLVSKSENKHYLSGFKGSAGWLLISETLAVLAVDFRYLEQAKIQSPEFEVIHIKGNNMEWLFDLVTAHKIHRIGFESSHISFSTYQQLYNTKCQKKCDFQLVGTDNLVESLRAIKEPGEIESIVSACEIVDAAFDYARQLIRPGMTEKQVAWEMEKFIRGIGSESVPFSFIVASGPNSAMPHATPTERKILPNEPIVVDMGAKSRWYCSDMSRTFFIGDRDKTYSRIYNITLSAQLAALSMITADISGEKADDLGRNLIEEAQYGEAFGHGTGHGIGLEPHELPRLGHGSGDILAEGMVFTVEPGIYIPGWGGIRIEDTVMIKNNTIVSLTHSDKIPYI